MSDCSAFLREIYTYQLAHGIRTSVRTASGIFVFTDCVSSALIYTYAWICVPWDTGLFNRSECCPFQDLRQGYHPIPGFDHLILSESGVSSFCFVPGNGSVLGAHHRSWDIRGTEFVRKRTRFYCSAVRTSIASPTWYESSSGSRGQCLTMKGQVLLGDVFHRMSSLNVSLFQRLSLDTILEYSSS